MVDSLVQFVLNFFDSTLHVSQKGVAKNPYINKMKKIYELILGWRRQATLVP